MVDETKCKISVRTDEIWYDSECSLSVSYNCYLTTVETKLFREFSRELYPDTDLIRFNRRNVS